MKISKTVLLISSAFIGLNVHAESKEIRCEKVIVGERVKTVYESSVKQVEEGIELIDVKKIVVNEAPQTIISESKSTWGKMELDERVDLDTGAAVFEIQAVTSSKIIFQATFPNYKNQAKGKGYSLLFDAKS
ncbi:MAG: hypothetical protein QE271_12730, partial [Bacteriovoracaceae bacterium]|nr:hypothetical protein [Bacteriovoracaceae bacterium]